MTIFDDDFDRELAQAVAVMRSATAKITEQQAAIDELKTQLASETVLYTQVNDKLVASDQTVRTLTTQLATANQLIADLKQQIPGPVTPTPVPTPTKIATRFGFYTGSVHFGTDYAAVEKWLNRKVELVHTFTPTNVGWAGLEIPAWLRQDLGPANNPYHDRMLITLGLLPRSGLEAGKEATLGGVAAGLHDDTWLSAAKGLVAAGCANAIIRLGHEHTGTWYPWTSVGHAKEYAAAFSHVVKVMKSVAGNSFQFEWNLALGKPVDLLSYPVGSVDYIGGDTYDNQTWANALTGGSDANVGLDDLVALGVKFGKPIAVSEWGLWPAKNGDDAAYVTNMAAWIRKQTNLAYHVPFDNDSDDSSHRLRPVSQYPKASAAFLGAFKGA